MSIPLPLSIAPKKFSLLLPPQAQYTDLYGWSPFDEKHFANIFLADKHRHHLLVREGGFAAFWKEAGLPSESAPRSDTNAVPPDRLHGILETAIRLTGFQQPPESRKTSVAPNVMDPMFSPWVASNVNKFAPLASHRKDYSGEVSTADVSMAASDVCSMAGAPCSDSGCQMCLTRESYESSTDRSMLGYESDVEGTDIEREYLRPSGIHTPSRLPRPVTGDRTPKQTDFAKVHSQPLTRMNAKYLRGSEGSDTTVSTVGYMSEDEKFVKGIV